MDGASLRSVIDSSGSLTPEEALGVTRGALMGLAHAHLLGLLHRDIKPENVLVDRDGTSKLADFGLAAPAGAAGGGHAPIGSPAYMSPETVAGEDIDVRSDIYSIGALLFELLTGRPPFVADSPLAVMRMQRTEPVPDPRTFNPALGEGVARFLMQCLAKDREVRPSSTHHALSMMGAVAAEAYGEDWQKRSSLRQKVASAMGAGLGLLGTVGSAGAIAATGTVGQALTASGVAAAAGAASTAAGGVLGVSTWVAVAVLAGVVALGGGGVYAISQGVLSASTGPSKTVALARPTVSPTALLSPSPDPTPSPSPSPSPSASASASAAPTPSPSPSHAVSSTAGKPTPLPTVSVTVVAPKPGPVVVSQLTAVMRYQFCFGTTCDPVGDAANCTAPGGGPGAGCVNPDCANYTIYVFEQYSWSFPGTTGTTVPVMVQWAGTRGDDGTPVVQPNTTHPSDSLASGTASGTHTAMSTGPGTLVIGPDVHAANGGVNYTLHWTNPNDGSIGQQTVVNTFYWGCG